MPLYTFVDNAVPSSSTWNANLRDQVITQCTSGTRPGSPVEGQHIFETDTDRLLYYSGSAWTIITEPRQTWTPTVAQSVTVTGTVNRGWYRRSNGLWEAGLKWTSSGAGTASNTVTLTTPATLLDANDVGGTFTVYDASTGVFHAGSIFQSSTTAFCLVVSGNTGRFGVAPAITLAASDEIYVHAFGTY